MLSICSKCCTRKTAIRQVTIQIQLVSYQCQHGHKLSNYQCQTNGHDLVSYRCQQGHKLLIDQCQTNGHDEEQITSLIFIKEEYIPTNVNVNRPNYCFMSI